MIEVSAAKVSVASRGFTIVISRDKTRAEVWRDGLECGVKVGSTLIQWEGEHAFISRNALSKIVG